MGVHYPTDVIGGFALGTAVALLLAPLAMMLLTPLTTADRGVAGRLADPGRAPRPGRRGAARASRSSPSPGRRARSAAARTSRPEAPDR